MAKCLGDTDEFLRRCVKGISSDNLYVLFDVVVQEMNRRKEQEKQEKQETESKNGNKTKIHNLRP